MTTEIPVIPVFPAAAIMEKRKSVRTYARTPIREEDRRAIMDYLADETLLRGPFGGQTAVEWVDAGQEAREESGKGLKLGTYGFIRNPQAYLAGCIPASEQAVLEFGYTFQRLILFATSLGLGTCWLGGSFTRKSFARELSLAPEHIIPCITPLGYAHDKPRLLESTIRFMSKADQRKPWNELFFDGEFGRPLTAEAAGVLQKPLEMVRIGPSASNRQPWRLVLSTDRRQVHFYLKQTLGYSAKLGFDMQRIDIGIAACNFELACRELGLQGSWHRQDPCLAPGEPMLHLLSFAFS